MPRSGRSPEAVAAVAKVPLESILALQRIWVANSDFNAAMTYLSRFGLTHHQVTTLVDRFGSQVVPILERDPYVLMREIPGFGFKRVDKIARKMGTPKDLPSRIRAGIHYCVLAALDDGDCWVEYEDLLDRANTLLVMDTLDSREVIEGHLEALIAGGQSLLPALRAAGGRRSGDPPDGAGAGGSVARRRARPSPHAVAERGRLARCRGRRTEPGAKGSREERVLLLHLADDRRRRQRKDVCGLDHRQHRRPPGTARRAGGAHGQGGQAPRTGRRP